MRWRRAHRKEAYLQQAPASTLAEGFTGPESAIRLLEFHYGFLPALRHWADRKRLERTLAVAVLPRCNPRPLPDPALKPSWHNASRHGEGSNFYFAGFRASWLHVNRGK